MAYPIGAFYVFAGVVVLRAMAADRFMDAALAALDAAPPSPVERTRWVWLVLGAGLTLAGGLALFLRSASAPALFLAGSLSQIAYLVWAARALPPESDAEAAGRRGTRRAALLYVAATVAVIGLAAADGLRSWPDGPLAWALDIAPPGLALVGGPAWAWWRGRPSPGGCAKPACEPAAEAPAFVAAADGAWRLAPSWMCGPLRDVASGDTLDIDALDLPADLRAALAAWDARFQATYHPDDPPAGGFADIDAARAWVAEGRGLVDRLSAAAGRRVVDALPEPGAIIAGRR
ncbi:MAG: hypothetical protein IPK81_16580 [Rhodospirillales bacterium]|nr:MAG: hypothetical protein IPK81_16580 [Rhodospirillales bacterium]